MSLRQTRLTLELSTIQTGLSSPSSSLYWFVADTDNRSRVHLPALLESLGQQDQQATSFLTTLYLAPRDDQIALSNLLALPRATSEPPLPCEPNPPCPYEKNSSVTWGHMIDSFPEMLSPSSRWSMRNRQHFNESKTTLPFLPILRACYEPPPSSRLLPYRASIH
jgi:hypothetical protein